MSLVHQSVSALLNAPFIIAGHGYDTGATPRREPSASEVGDVGGGIPTTSIVAVAVVALVTLGVLVWMNPSRAVARVRAMAPMALIAVIIAAPLAGWAVTSDGDDESAVVIERATGAKGVPELLISLLDDELNTLDTTNGQQVVRVECRGRDGQVVLEADQKWPFVITEQGFDLPHAHQPATAEALKRAVRCRLHGTRVRLEAAVQDALTD